LIPKLDGLQNHQNELSRACHLDFGVYLLETFFQRVLIQNRKAKTYASYDFEVLKNRKLCVKGWSYIEIAREDGMSDFALLKIAASCAGAIFCIVISILFLAM
jgi:hypothetical protein